MGWPPSAPDPSVSVRRPCVPAPPVLASAAVMSTPNPAIYFFGNGEADGHGTMKALLGGKGAGLAEMTRLGLPVPPGFTITTECCVHYYQSGAMQPGLLDGVHASMARVEALMGRRFGDADAPLLVSVRSGSRASMPGMMDTILNLGLNATTVQGLIRASGNARFGYDAWRRFIQMYSDVVLGVPMKRFHEALEALKRARGVTEDTALTADDLRGLVDTYHGLVRAGTGQPFPEDPWAQLQGAIEAVFRSWMNPRAIEYRKAERIPDDWGTAVNVQSMVFGNMGDDCATGVAFTRNPNTGERVFFGEFLPNAQGEDVVAGIRTPRHLNGAESTTLQRTMPEVYAQLDTLRLKLESHYQDMQDIEFTIERGKLYMLQTRNGKRTPAAAVRIATEMVAEGVIDQRTAVSRVTPSQIEKLLHWRVDTVAIQAAGTTPLARGLGVGAAAASGHLVFTAEDAVAWAADGKPVILVRDETSPEDVGGMRAAKGIVTARGGATSHAAVVARGWGLPCVVGCGTLHVDEHRKVCRVGDALELAEGELVTIDGEAGLVYRGPQPLLPPDLGPAFTTILAWADTLRRLGIRTNADTPQDAQQARELGAAGIGLCRTEHMFFDAERLPAVRAMILAKSREERLHALAKLLPFQKGDFLGIFRAMKGFPVTIRLLDPPLHEFLPHDREGQVEVAAQLGLDVEAVAGRVESLRELNPMLGHRGCRLAITWPEIYEMQVEAITAAACELVRDEGFTIIPEIMIPLVATTKELEVLRAQTVAVAERVIADYGVPLHYLVGTMIELPRACVAAGDIAHHADFFSFGTNDLTQTTFGLSRDDATKFLPTYVEKGVLPIDPFLSLDRGVAELMGLACARGRATKAGLKLGICGEHGGDPDSITMCHDLGLDYVSCSPFRVPVARMAAAHAALRS